MIKCGLCGKEFEDNQFEEYATHVQKCAYERSLKAKTEEMKKINEEIEEVKRAKVCYEGLRDAFKEKYPDIYKKNFSNEAEKDEEKENKGNTVKFKDMDIKDLDLMDFFTLLSTLPY